MRLSLKSNQNIQAKSQYSAVITREQFLFYEVRTTARLFCEGLSHDVIIDRIVKENLFQYPTEKSLKRMALTCLRRLETLEDKSLVEAITSQPSEADMSVCDDEAVPSSLGLYDYSRGSEIPIIGHVVRQERLECFLHAFARAG